MFFLFSSGRVFPTFAKAFAAHTAVPVQCPATQQIGKLGSVAFETW